MRLFEVAGISGLARVNGQYVKEDSYQFLR
jgi:hypothetical protein